MNKWAWVSFWILSFIWGSSFLLIRVGVEEVSATQLVLVRCAIAALGLNAVRYLKGKHLPTDWPTIRAFIIIGIGNAAVPYTFISLGEQSISSGMAAILQSTASLFTLIIAHFALADERISRRKVAGLAVGFAGILVLSSGSIDEGKINTAILLGQLAIVCASLCYGLFTVYSRRIIMRQIEPIVLSSGTFISATVCALVFMILEPLLGGRAAVSLTSLPQDTLFVLLGLGFFNTFIAYLFFYYIVQQLGSFRASMVTYVVPAVGLILGWLILDEHVAAYMLIGAALIFTGIGIINVRPRAIWRMRTAAVAANHP